MNEIILSFKPEFFKALLTGKSILNIVQGFLKKKR